jgi:hypothetical protein
MSQYFDKNFLKFLLGFTAIIIITLIIIAVLEKYQSKEQQTLPAVQTAATNQP